MNAESLIGVSLGSCMLQRLLGQGGMGAVFLAQQSRPRRRVAVKVLFPVTSLNPNQLASFLERFRRETDAAASLQHPNIMPVHEYGEQGGLAYLVMPYIDGGTLRDELEREGALPFPRVVHYLEQLAAALDFAHERGIVHRDVKPANILKTAEGRLLLTDFGLVKVLAAEQSAQVRLTGAGAPMGTPDFMSPEQVLGEQVDGRADLYSLGIILYQMVTGVLPFRGETPMQVAAQHLQVPPRSPRLLRGDLPVAAEQILLRTLAKRPADRYMLAQDMAAAFRVALSAAGISLEESQDAPAPVNEQVAGRIFTRRGLFDPVPHPAAPEPTHEDQSQQSSLRTAASPVLPTRPTARPPASLLGPRLGKKGLLRPAGETGTALPAAPGDPHTPLPLTPTALPPASSGLLSNARMPTSFNAPLPTGGLPSTPSEPARQATATTRIFPPSALPGKLGTSPTPAAAMPDVLAPPNDAQRVPLAIEPKPTRLLSSLAGRSQAPDTLPAPPQTGNADASSASMMTGQPTPTGMLPASTGMHMAFPAGGMNPTGTLPTFGTTSTLSLTGYGQGTATGNTVKLTGPMRVVQVPVAGQPGRYLTGLLPVLGDAPKPAPSPEVKQAPLTQARSFVNTRLSKRMQAMALIVTLLLVLVSSVGIFWFTRSHAGTAHTAPKSHTAAMPNINATATRQVQATADANTILSDPLSQNIHNWPVATSGSKLYVFENGAYHITDNDANSSAPAIMLDAPATIMSQPFAYSLTMQEIKGNDSSINNQFGMIIRYSTQAKNGKTITRFYTFEIVNKKGGEYQFWKYDDTWAAKATPWTEIWHHPFGKELHQGQGPDKVNTVKIFADGPHFTLTVNDKQVGTVKENAIASGVVGMLVNLKGTEVAFTDLQLTYH
ncbi:MAG: protein kinase [Ktedonobacteraceae bacterium]|nr:protein kinase [Ktedonobacteraceae bacterium]